MGRASAEAQLSSASPRPLADWMPERVGAGGDESFWTDKLKMNQVIQSVDPKTALSVGLKVDAAALPDEVVAGVKDGSISLTDPATTLALLKLDAVVGVKGTVTTADDGTDML